MKTDHPVTQIQKQIVKEIIDRLHKENNQNNNALYKNIKVLGSDYSNEIFIAFDKFSPDWNKGEPGFKKKYLGISINGKIDYEVLKRKFNNLSDRVHFFNSLYEIKI